MWVPLCLAPVSGNEALPRWVPRENSFFRETLGESGRVGPRIGVFGHPAALRCQRQGPSDGARPHGCCRGTMWVPCWVGGYPRETLGESGRVGPRIGVFGHPAALRCQRQGPSDGARPHGCCRGPCGYPWWVPRENSFFRETLGESGRVGPRIGVFGHPAALRCQRQGPSDGARPHGCCRGTMWVPCWVGGYPGKTRFLGRLWVQVLGGGVVTMYEHGYDPSVA